MSRRRRGIAELHSALVLVVISLSMAYVVYSQARMPTAQSPVFANTAQVLEGRPSLLMVQSNASRTVSLQNVIIDSTPATGILAWDGSGYSTGQSLCLAGTTTFFSVLVRYPGTLRVLTNGKSWIVGLWSASATVAAGWNEVMISDGSSCAVVLPDGSTLTSVESGISRVPVTGAFNASAFTIFIPWNGNGHLIQLIFEDGVDRLEI